MYYKTLGFFTHRVIIGYLKSRLPERERVRTVAVVAAIGLITVGVVGVAARSRRTVPTV